MLFKYLKSLWAKLVNSKPLTKVLTIVITLILVFMAVISFWKVDYVIYTPGFLGNPVGTVNVDSENSKGRINVVSVISYDKPSLIQLWSARLDKRILVEKVDHDYSDEDERPVNITSKWISINKAIIYAYEKAQEVDPSITLVKSFMGAIVYFSSDKAETSLTSSDIITEVEGVKITSYDHLVEIYNNIIGKTKFAGDYINFKVCTRQSETLTERSAIIYADDDGRLTTGLYLDEYYDLDGTNSKPGFKINYRENVDSSGNSGGAMLALSIYNSLIKEDVTKGKFVVGTGTIDLDGKVGRIGCVEQKVVKAYQNKADYFFVCDNVYTDSNGNSLPTDYELCIKAAQSYGYDTNFIKPVKTFDDILNELKKGAN